MSIRTKLRVAGLVPLASLLLSLGADRALAAGPMGSPGKPGAPVELRWLETGDQGRISVEVVAGIDYDALELRLMMPGLEGAPAPVSIGAGTAGAVRRADWYLADAPNVAPRVLVILEKDGRRLGRVVPAPWQAGKTLAPAAARAPVPPATADGLIEMRGETRYGGGAANGDGSD